MVREDDRQDHQPDQRMIAIDSFGIDKTRSIPSIAGMGLQFWPQSHQVSSQLTEAQLLLRSHRRRAEGRSRSW